MKLLMGLEQKMVFDFMFMMQHEKLHGFITNRRSLNSKYIEFTPYNKGNLWKLRYFYEGHFKVFYGTKETAYCTTLKDCLSIIQPKQLTCTK